MLPVNAYLEPLGVITANIVISGKYYKNPTSAYRSGNIKVKKTPITGWVVCENYIVLIKTMMEELHFKTWSDMSFLGKLMKNVNFNTEIKGSHAVVEGYILKGWTVVIPAGTQRWNNISTLIQRLGRWLNVETIYVNTVRLLVISAFSYPASVLLKFVPDHYRPDRNSVGPITVQ